MFLAEYKIMHLVLEIFISTREPVTYARSTFKPRCCLNFQSMRTQVEPNDVVHNMLEQIKIEIPWYKSRHTVNNRKRDSKTWITVGQLVVVRVRIQQLSVFPNTSHPVLQVCSKLLHGNSTPSLDSWYKWLTLTQYWEALSNWAVQQALEQGCKLRLAWTTFHKVTVIV